jgi:SAM-dependent methyltransferase
LTGADRASRSFGAVAGLYHRVRPGYPESAVSWALAPLGSGPLRVVDLGAGTGILSRAIAALGHQVLAVEPDARMRDFLENNQPSGSNQVEALCGSAEAMPLLDGSVDAVLAGQAYHWFDPRHAHSEIGRVLRSGGVFAAIWNDRDESQGWLAELSVILSGMAGSAAGRSKSHSGPVDLGNNFGPVEPGIFSHSTTHTVESLLDLVRSRSYFLTAPPDRRNRILSTIRAMAEEHPDLDTGTTFELPYLTRVYRARRL